MGLVSDKMSAFPLEELHKVRFAGKTALVVATLR